MRPNLRKLPEPIKLTAKPVLKITTKPNARTTK
jgi:hypothetical protein